VTIKLRFIILPPARLSRRERRGDGPRDDERASLLHLPVVPRRQRRHAEASENQEEQQPQQQQQTQETSQRRRRVLGRVERERAGANLIKLFPG